MLGSKWTKNPSIAVNIAKKPSFAVKTAKNPSIAVKTAIDGLFLVPN